MHLLAATPGQIDDGSEAIDLGQTPADIIYISAADTELAALSEAHTDLNSNTSLRLANLTHLSHPMSVDLHIDACASKSKIVIARILGGTGYWKYGIEQRGTWHLDKKLLSPPFGVDERGTRADVARKPLATSAIWSW